MPKPEEHIVHIVRSGIDRRLYCNGQFGNPAGEWMRTVDGISEVTDPVAEEICVPCWNTLRRIQLGLDVDMEVAV